MPALAAGCVAPAIQPAAKAEIRHTTLNSGWASEFPLSASAKGTAMDTESKRKHRGVRVVHANELDINTAQTPGMNRAAAITNARAGAEKLWAGTVVIHPKAKTGAHHHGPVESVIYVVSGRARMRWGDRLEFVAEA